MGQCVYSTGKLCVCVSYVCVRSGVKRQEITGPLLTENLAEKIV